MGDGMITAAQPPLLTAETVPGYVAATPELVARLDGAPVRSVREVGDGNLNLVFVVDADNGRSLVLKQSLPHVRTDPSWPMTRERTAREARVLAVHHRLDPAHVAEPLHFDADRLVLAVEDLSDHTVWRQAFDAGEEHPHAAADLGAYVARAAFGTSVFGMPAVEQKALLAASVNPELCEITEDLVFTEPYVDHPHNGYLAENAPDVAEYAGDPDVVREIGLAKLSFMTHAEALLHGDLHTGSVFVRGEPRSTKVFDAEFGCYGPVGFDLGALWGNFVLAAARAHVLGETGRAARTLDLPAALWQAFEREWWSLWPGRVDPRVHPDTVGAAFLARVREDAAVFAAAKASRRIIGFAKVSDIETLDLPLRARAARGVLRAARLLALDRHATPDPGKLSAKVADVLDED